MKHLWRYLKKTRTMGIKLGGSYDRRDLKARVYADAAFANNLDNRYSTARHVIFVADGPVYWQSKRQSLVTVSLTEAEFINLTPAGKSLLWIANITDEMMGVDQPRPWMLFTDSQNALAAVVNKAVTRRTRHIDIYFKWIVDRVKKGHFTVKHVGTNEMAANGLTKALNFQGQAHFLQQLKIETPKK